MKFVVAAAAAAIIVLSMTPVMAKSKKHHRHHAYHNSQQYHAWDWNESGWNGWNSRNVSDPSFGNRAGIANARRNGRCAVDLGYGRYEYCD
jgi:hypothetical protein